MLVLRLEDVDKRLTGSNDQLAQLGAATHGSQLVGKAHTRSKNGCMRRRVRHSCAPSHRETVNRGEERAVDAINRRRHLVQNDREWGRRGRSVNDCYGRRGERCRFWGRRSARSRGNRHHRNPLIHLCATPFISRLDRIHTFLSVQSDPSLNKSCRRIAP